MKKHDESKDLQILSKFARISRAGKIISAAKNSLGLKLLGRVDYLRRKGWSLVYED